MRSIRMLVVLKMLTVLKDNKWNTDTVSTLIPLGSMHVHVNYITLLAMYSQVSFRVNKYVQLRLIICFVMMSENYWCVSTHPHVAITRLEYWKPHSLAMHRSFALVIQLCVGVMTGKCVQPDRPVSGNYNMCEIYSWCPVEFDQLPMPGTNFGKPLKK